MNNSQEIILAQISAIYDKPPFVKVKTGQMEMILKCVGSEEKIILSGESDWNMK